MADDRDQGGEIVVEDEVLNAGFVQVPVLVLRDPDLSFGAKLAYGALLWYHYRGRGFPGIKPMAEEFGMGERTAIRFLGELENRGYVLVTRPRLGKRNTYRLPRLVGCQVGSRSGAKLALQDCQVGTSTVVLDSQDVRGTTTSPGGSDEAQAGAGVVVEPLRSDDHDLAARLAALGVSAAALGELPVVVKVAGDKIIVPGGDLEW